MCHADLVVDHDRGAALPTRARVLLVVACLATLVPAAALVPDPATALWVRIVTAALVVAQAAALWRMSASPGRATAVVIAAGAAIQLMQPVLGFGITVVALSTLAWLRPPRTSLWALGAVLALTVLDGILARPWAEALLWAAGAALAWTWGELGRVTSARRRAETRRAILEERARIARELHDVLAHTVSVMVVQAGAADDVFESSPQRSREAVRAVAATGRQAQAELQQLLRTVAPDQDARAHPQPGLADVERLGATVAQAGLDVTTEVAVTVAVPPGVALSAYRIVQESLTNALRHADAEHAEVRVHVVDAALLVDVHDDGQGGHTTGSGRGLVGMRERAELLGGTLSAGPDPAGGWRVTAHLPMRAS